MFLNTIEEGAYAKHAILNCLMISDYILEHERQRGSMVRIPFLFG